MALAALTPSAGAKVSSSFDKQILTVAGGKGKDRMVVSCGADGNAKVNGDDPGSGAVACSRVVEVDAQGGGGNDVIDFSAVTASFGSAEFPGFGTATGTAAVGGEGNDRFIPSKVAFNLFYGEGGNDHADGGPLRDLLSGGAGSDVLRGGDGRDSVLGNGGADRLFGGADADVVSGNADDDLLSGGAGDDAVFGGAGRDRLAGGPGGDKLVGGPGKDLLRGGSGNDTEIEAPPKKPAKP
ncbi:MAG: hypothetical protein M3M99_04805 [Actinomycetota bacterium]|nr:hypothetical protein [Actinomycetota bacterium]